MAAAFWSSGHRPGPESVVCPAARPEPVGRPSIASHSGARSHIEPSRGLTQQEDADDMASRSYSSFAEFEREEIRPNFRIGFCMDDIEEAALDPGALEEFEGDEFFQDEEESGRF